MKKKPDTRPVLAVTLGDPVGIGPEIIVKALHRGGCYRFSRPVILGDPLRLEVAGTSTGLSPEIRVIANPKEGRYTPGRINVVPLSRLASEKIRWGHPLRSTAAAAIRYVTKAVDMVQNREADALVTCPLHKSAFRMTRLPYAGHTELLAERTGASDFVMMMAGRRLKVALVTIHEPLREVPGLLTAERVLRTLLLTAEGLRERFGIPHPLLAVAGLNPHSGENGRFGNEEKQILQPAIRRALRKGYRIAGPFPPDTVFHQALTGAFDAVVALYHDQGLIPFKLIHFKDGVNTTLGLPLIRTSVDHGTAYDIAGTGKADPGSLVAAIRMAAEQVGYQHLAVRSRHGSRV